MSDCEQNIHLFCHGAHVDKQIKLWLPPIVLLRIPSLHPNPQSLPQFFRIRIRGFLAAIYGGFETISRRPEIKDILHVTHCMAIINAMTVIARHTSLKSSAHPQCLHTAVHAKWKASQATYVGIAHVHGPTPTVHICLLRVYGREASADCRVISWALREEELQSHHVG